MKEINELLSLKLDKDNKEVVKTICEKLKIHIDSLDKQINGYQLEKFDIIKTRDNIKGKYKSALSKIGVSSDSTDVEKEIEEKIESLNKKKNLDETTKTEMLNLKKEIDKLNQEKLSIKAEMDNRILNIALEKDIATLLPKFQARPQASKYIINDIKQKAKFENGKLSFKNPDNTTLRISGKDAELEDILKEMKEKAISDKNEMFFCNQVQSSGESREGLGGKLAKGKYKPRANLSIEDILREKQQF